MGEGWLAAEGDLTALSSREWVVTNGIGGYAASTVPMLNTRKYHGLLVAAMAPPHGRMVLLSRVEETLVCSGARFPLACNEYPGTIHPPGHTLLRAFDHEPFPRWGYQGDGWTLEKQLRLLEGSNTVVLSWSLLGCGSSAELELRPLFAMRPVHELMFQSNVPLRAQPCGHHAYHVPPTQRTPELFFAHAGSFESSPTWYLNTIYRREEERGYSGLEDLWSPGIARLKLLPGQSAHFVCSTEPIDFEEAIAQVSHQYSAAPPRVAATSPRGMATPIDVASVPGAVASVETARSQLERSLALKVGPQRTGDATAPDDRYLHALQQAARQFVVSGVNGSSRAKQRWVMAGLFWHGLSVRSALAGFTGLFCSTDRFDDGRLLLSGLVPLLRDGLLPIDFTESGDARYGGADISLWWINAVHAYLRYTNDEATVRQAFFEPVLRIINAYRCGSAPNIAIDSEGLLASHLPGGATTWMDAKAGDWVITPRGGRAVEVNALWYNALCIAADLARRFGLPAEHADLSSRAKQIHACFNQRFWNDRLGCCFDVVAHGGSDASLRPNQLLAISLPFAVLEPARHARVLQVVQEELLTPMGVRSLAPDDPSYGGRYTGGIVSRDRALHNGSAWPWLLGHLTTAMLKVRGRDRAARAAALDLLKPVLQYMTTQGLGQICELFDGELPQEPRGAIASALSTAELLRAYCEDVLEIGPQPIPTPALPIQLLGSPDPSGSSTLC